MTTTSVHLSQCVRCSARQAYDFARNPANLPRWALGLGGEVRLVGGQWRVTTPVGEAVIEFVPVNDHLVLDHTVVLPDGTRSCNPMRVLPDGDGCDVVFTLRRRPASTDDEFEQDAAAVAQDLLTLKRVLESARDPTP